MSADVSQTGYASGRATRILLIQTAERLFAERGIGFVSLREIALAAGQRNKAIMQYYFGNKEGLVASINDHRRAQLTRRRLELTDSLPADILVTKNVGAVLELLLRPYAETIADPQDNFLGFTARHMSDQPDFNAANTGEDVHDTGRGYWQLRDLARQCLPELSDEQFSDRFSLVFTWGIHALAEYERLHPDAEGEAIDRRLREIATMLANALRA